MLLSKNCLGKKYYYHFVYGVSLIFNACVIIIVILKMNVNVGGIFVNIKLERLTFRARFDGQHEFR